MVPEGTIIIVSVLFLQFSIRSANQKTAFDPYRMLHFVLCNIVALKSRDILVQDLSVFSSGSMAVLY